MNQGRLQFHLETEIQNRQCDICPQEKHQINHGVKRVKTRKPTTKTMNFTGDLHHDFKTDHKGSYSSDTTRITSFT